MLREPFDYTEWQCELYNGVILEEFYYNVRSFRETKQKQN
jgi:hypothetical protein